MKYYQCDVEFDLDLDEGEEPEDPNYKILIADPCTRIKDPENELADVISDNFGWCVNTISYKDYNDAECPPADKFDPDAFLLLSCEDFD